MSNGSATAANEILNELLGQTVNLDPIDFGSGLFDLPDDTDSAIYGNIDKLTISEITSGKVNGDGLFDKLMTAVNAHLAIQYEKNRITGGDYSKTYIALTTVAMQQALQFASIRETTYWSSVQAQVAAIQGRVALETAKANYSTNLIQFATAKVTLATTDSQYGAAQYQLENMLPQQLKLLLEQTEAQRAQTKDTRTDGSVVAGTLGKQVALYSQQITSYQRNAETTAARLFVDSWITQKTLDSGITAPSNLANDSVNTVLGNIKTNNGLA